MLIFTVRGNSSITVEIVTDRLACVTDRAWLENQLLTALTD